VSEPSARREVAGAVEVAQPAEPVSVDEPTPPSEREALESGVSEAVVMPSAPPTTVLPAVSSRRSPLVGTARGVQPPIPAGAVPVRLRAESGIEISIDGEVRGRAPLFGVLLTPGPHQVELRRENGTVRSVEILVDPADPVIDLQ
jgi:hypothetical protein